MSFFDGNKHYFKKIFFFHMRSNEKNPKFPMTLTHLGRIVSPIPEPTALYGHIAPDLEYALLIRGDS